MLVEDTITLPVQVNGRKRAEVTVARDAEAKEIEAAALALDEVKRALEGKPPRKVIVVPQRIVNVVGLTAVLWTAAGGRLARRADGRLLPADVCRAHGDRRAGAARQLSAVDVSDITHGRRRRRPARVELRNGLIFSFTGGGGPAPPTHKLVVRMSTTRTSAIVDLTTARPDIENYGIDVTYELREIATNKPVMRATTFARVSYDIPGQEQRFARIRGLRDAESRATKQIAENISQRLSAFFVAGT